MFHLRMIVKRIKRGWHWLIAGPARQERDIVAFIIGDRVELRYLIGGHTYLLKYNAEKYDDARGYALMWAREPGPFNFDDAETVIELIDTIAEWRPASAIAI